MFNWVRDELIVLLANDETKQIDRCSIGLPWMNAFWRFGGRLREVSENRQRNRLATAVDHCFVLELTARGFVFRLRAGMNFPILLIEFRGTQDDRIAA